MTREAAARASECIPESFEFSDLDVSGRKDVPRPGLDKALQALLDESIGTLYVAKLDRLTRRGMAHIGAILDDLERVSGRIVFVADGLDTSKPGARQVIAILAEQARAESDNIAWRIEQWHAHNRRNGLWKRRRPYGYTVEQGRLRPHPEEAPIVRRMMERFLAGGSLRSIAIGLNDEGVKPPRLTIWYEEAQAKGNLRAKPPMAGLWAYDTVKSILTQPALSALISHKGQPVYNDDGNLVFAGEGIASVAERARILAEMERRSTITRNDKAPRRVGKRTGGGKPVKYLLVGLIRCGECGSVSAGGRHRKAKDSPTTDVPVGPGGSRVLGP
jgi:site-specific DNA recombinase